MQSKIENTSRPELVFALVGQAGVRIENYSQILRDHLNTFGYKTIDIKLSELLRNFTGWTDVHDTSEATRIMHRQEMGLKFRSSLNEGTGDGAALARAAIVKIREERAKNSGNPDVAASEYAFILNQLKHPDEVKLLRDVYGSSFILLAGHAPKDLRRKNLAVRLKNDKYDERYAQEKAEHIIVDDEKQVDDLGQNTRDAYPLADYFGGFERNKENQVTRFVDLLFGHPFHTPLPDEHAMFQAYAGSLRSSDESRQVGAVIVELAKNQSGKVTKVDVVASGMNEVPRRGGGFYWHEDSEDARDQNVKYIEGVDRADKIKVDVLTELIDKLQESNLLHERMCETPSHQLAREFLKKLKGTQFLNIGEFMRTVHAEMAALIDSARRGVAVDGLSMFVTTFPCHNCAKHIIAAGLKQVVYLEPYPKSRAEALHGEEISLEPIDGVALNEKVAFLAFTGVAPRQYQQLFSMTRRGARNGLSLKDWEGKKMTLSPRYVEKNAAATYILAERQKLAKLPVDIYKWDINTVCPELK